HHQAGRPRPGPGDLEADRRAAGRHDRGGERSRARDRVHAAVPGARRLVGAGRCKRGQSSAGRVEHMFRMLVKTSKLSVDTRTVGVRYFELRTLRGGLRYSAEIVLGADDRIILDDDSVSNLEARVARLVPATLLSRRLARATAA